jgi:hypothetical protein
MKKPAAQSGKPSPRPRRPRPKLLPISEEMRHWSAMLETEACSWPKITTKPMFGFLSFYRAGKIFAAIPRTRGFGAASALILKFDPMLPPLLQKAQSDSRLDTSTRIPGKGWFSFEISSNEDLRDALWWLGRAYDSAKGAAR